MSQLETETKVEIKTQSSTVNTSWLILRFLVGWIFSIIILVGVALMINIDWARPKMQEVMAEALHRPVKLGHLRWYLGLNGITITTRNIIVEEKNGDPFLKARSINLGLSTRALLTGKVVLKHLKFDHPEFHAVKLKPGGWNFEDLLVDSTEVHFIQVDGGKVLVKDESKDAVVKEAVNLEDVTFKFNWPRPDQKLPIYLSLALPSSDNAKARNYLRVEGFTTGSKKGLIDTALSLNLSASDMHSDDLRKLLAIALDDKEQKATLAGSGDKQKRPVSDLDALVSFKMDLNGDVNKGFNSTISTEFKDLSLKGRNIGEIKTNDVKSQGAISLDKNELKWKDLSLNIGGIAISSKGNLNDWQGKEPSYKVDVESNIADLTKVGKALDLTKLKKDKENDAIKDLTRKLSGKAFFQINVEGLAKQARLITKMELEGLPIGELVESISPESAPYLALAGITRETKVKGHIESHPGRKLKINSGQISVPDSLIKLEGELDLLRDEMDLKFNLDQLSLKKVWTKALDSKETVKFLTSHLEGKAPKDLLVEGLIKANGTVRKMRSRSYPEMTMTTELKGGSFGAKDRSLTTSDILGKLDLKDGNLALKSIEGKFGKTGRFTLTGNIKNVLGALPQSDISFYGNNIEFDNLGKVMSLFGFAFPAITEGHLTGRVKELSIKISGNPKKPQVFLSAAPEDISYQPPGLSRSLNAVSGSIVFANDKITLSDVDIVTHGMKLTTSLTISDLSGKAGLSNLHLKSDGIDIADIDYYLTSPVLPAPLRKQYRDFLNVYKIKNLHGRIYGDLVVEPRDRGDADIEGVIGCYSVGALVGQKNELELPLEKIAGIIAASGNELLIQDLSGSIRSSEFQLNGTVKDYKSKTPSWKTDLRLTFAPNEFLDLVPHITKSLTSGKMEVLSKGPLLIKAQVQGNPENNSMIFNCHADANNDLRISTPLFTINQPKGDELNLDGSVSLDKNGMTLHSTNLLVGEAGLKAQGGYKWIDDSINLTVLSPNPVPAKTIIGLVDPNLNTANMLGTIDGSIAVEGTIRQPKLSGKLSLDRVGNKDYEIYDVNGTIATENISAVKNSADAISVARVDIDRLRYRKLRVNDIGGVVEVLSAGTTGKDGTTNPPKIHLKDVTARAAGGHIKMDGSFDLARNATAFNAYLSKIHMEEIVDRVFDAPDEMTGALDGELHLTTRGTSDKEMLTNLEGTGSINIEKGIVARFGQLQTKLTQANLLSQGILGFNLNNLLQSVAPVRSGEFNELTSRFHIYKGALALKELRFSGDDLRLWGAGAADLTENTVDIEIAGTLPRVTESFLGGTLGRLSRNITVSGILSKVTFGALENLPSLPIIGDIASDKPRAFSFKVQAPAQDAKQIAKSIEKSFRFLPNKQAASAHPVPGL